MGQTTLDSRLRYDAYSPHHQLTMTASGHHLRSGADTLSGPGHQNINGSPCRSPGGGDTSFNKNSHNRYEIFYCIPYDVEILLSNDNLPFLNDYNVMI